MPTSAQTDNQWKPIETAPVGPVVVLLNEPTGVVAPGYGEWMPKAPRPRWISMEPTGVGRFKATHWADLPAAPAGEVRS